MFGTFPMAATEVILRRPSEAPAAEAEHADGPPGIALRTFNFFDGPDEDLMALQTSDSISGAEALLDMLDDLDEADASLTRGPGKSAEKALLTFNMFDGPSGLGESMAIPPGLFPMPLHPPGHLPAPHAPMKLGFPMMLPSALWGYAVPPLAAPPAKAPAKAKRQARRCGGCDAAEAAPLPQHVVDAYDSLMLRRMPRKKYDWKDAKKLLDEHGFELRYRFLYMPIDFKRHCGYGYCLVVFDSHATAVEAQERLAGFSDWGRESELDVSVAEVQGLEEHIERYRDSPVMHEAVPDDYKPRLFDWNGLRVPFPEPRKHIRAPAGCRRACGALDGLPEDAEPQAESD